jgi:hypothetical protein
MLENDLMQDLDAIEKVGGAILLRPQGILPSIGTSRDVNANRSPKSKNNLKSKDNKTNS